VPVRTDPFLTPLARALAPDLQGLVAYTPETTAQKIAELRVHHDWIANFVQTLPQRHEMEEMERTVRALRDEVAALRNILSGRAA
jgi:polyhydroxyalkanoate synthesis regulator phasin